MTCFICLYIAKSKQTHVILFLIIIQIQFLISYVVTLSNFIFEINEKVNKVFFLSIKEKKTLQNFFNFFYDVLKIA